MDSAVIKEIILAYRVLFPTVSSPSLTNISRLNLTTLKKEYRKKALETHPDRARLLGLSNDKLKQQFQMVTRSYNKLCSFIEENPDFNIQFQQKYYRERENKTSQPQRFNRPLYSQNRLLFGQFLYYSGLITAQAMHAAILWQRRQRPRYGKIAREWDILSVEDIIEILRSTLIREKFGQGARRLGRLNQFEHKAILAKQYNLQRPIGEYFLCKGILRPRELKNLLEEQRLYNRTIIDCPGTDK